MLWKLRLPLLALVLLLGLPALAQAGPPRSAIFFYPWYSNMRHDGGFTHWTQGGHVPPLDVASQFYPARGAYSSADPRVLAAQMRETLASAKKAADTLQATLDDTRPAARELSESTLPAAESALRDLNRTTASLRAMTESIQNQGAGSLIKGKQLPDYKP